ncbi:aldo-keto reductase, putative [Sistotremastrum suecicum HHB10207 ss-3]|uniref:Aldo-keto reductase, putative n=1 Tax=Sistotremastrum suecicum HHB10207 ss-3 TaxID=1314776 RepID=A0A165ZNI7_9AGAM|nr:aldo-keto reductase, putative [Sistotremastrum suecicum HHB10207 ss-3]
MTPSLATRKLGKNGPEVTAIGFGAMGISAFYTTGKTSDEESFKLLDHIVDSGCTFWDTSDIYMNNEDVIGAWFKRTGRRTEIFLCTKFASSIDKDGNRVVRGDPEYVHQACARSLKRLGIDVIDLYYVHRIDPKVPIEKTVGAIAELVKAGKVRHVGLSECSSETLRRAYAVHPIAAVQMEYSPFALEIESEQTKLLATARELGVAIVAYSPLGRGVLTGQYKSRDDFAPDDFRLAMPRFSAENFDKNLVLVDKLRVLAERKGATPGQLTLAWILAQGPDFIPIPGTKKIKYFDENIGALNVQLTPEEIQEIRAASEAAEVKGGRYPEAMMQYCFGDTPAL